VEAKLDPSALRMPDFALNADVAELVTIWQTLTPSRRRLLLEQFREAARAERAAKDALEPPASGRK